MKKVDIKKLHPNETNPRQIKTDKFNQLVKSIKEFPEMLELRPIVVNEDMEILGGNMRYRASLEAGIKKIPIKIAEGLSYAQQREFIIKDNISFGKWDWDVLANEWDNVDLGEWGMDVWQPDELVDYSVLEDLGGNMRYRASLEAGIKKIPIKIAEGLSYAQQREFIIKDNISFGKWDWDVLANEWDNVDLGEWGMDVWQPDELVDYSVLEDLEMYNEDVEDKEKSVLRSHCIQFSIPDYEECAELLKELNGKQVYVGEIILNALKNHK